MKQQLSAAFAIMAALSFTVWADGGTVDTMLSAYLWKNRPLILFSPSPENPSFISALNGLSKRMEHATDRHMVIIEVLGNGDVRRGGKLDHQHDADALRRRFSVPKGELTAVLIGKDGSVKLRQSGNVDWDEIFALIDTMPMRQREMRNGKD